jgi:hypothetical protein
MTKEQDKHQPFPMDAWTKACRSFLIECSHIFLPVVILGWSEIVMLEESSPVADTSIQCPFHASRR